MFKGVIYGTPFVAKIGHDLRWCSNNEVVLPLYFRNVSVINLFILRHLTAAAIYNLVKLFAVVYSTYFNRQPLYFREVCDINLHFREVVDINFSILKGLLISTSILDRLVISISLF